MKRKFIYAYDPKIKRRCVFVIKKGEAISLLTGYRIKRITNLKCEI